MSEAHFRIKNNDTRSHGIAGRICVAGSGCVTPPEAKKVGFSLPPLFGLTEEEMFKSFRGIVKIMAEYTKTGLPVLEVFVDGVKERLTDKDLAGWVADYRARHKLSEPKNSDEDFAELSKAMNIKEDPIERQMRTTKENDQAVMARVVAQTVVEVMRQERAAQAAEQPKRGRNDEQPEKR